MTGPGTPAAGEGLTAAWMHEALRAGGRADCPNVRELKCEAIAEGVGLMAEIFRCELTFAADDGPSESVIVKLPSDKPRNRKLGRRWRLYRREFSFYRHLASASPLRAPALLYGDFDPRTHRFVLVLEDLRNLAAADQVRGATPEQARRAVREVAGLHGEYWDRVERVPADFHEVLPPWVWSALQVSYLLSLPRSLSLLSGSWPEEVRDLAEEYGLRLVDHLGQLVNEPLTFVHGDYRLDNMFFDGDGLTVVDWQNSAVSNGLYDVAYFLAGSVSPEVRRAVEKEALLEYHDIVCSLGAREFPFERCWRLYRETLLGCLVLPVVVTGWLEESQGRQLELRDAIATRTATALKDQDAGAFLPETPPFLSRAGLRSALCRGGYRAYRALTRS